LRQRLGLRPSPPDPDEWVAVASARIDDTDTGDSMIASRLAEVLGEAGIEAQQRRYVVPDNHSLPTFTSGPGARDRLQVAVLVRRRDLQRTQERLRDLQEERESDGLEGQRQLGPEPD